MNRLISSALALSLVLGLVLIAGCSDDDPAQPDPETYVGLWGYVVDSDGNAVPDASIGVILDYPVFYGAGSRQVVVTHPLQKPTTRISYVMPDSGHLRIWIEDYAGGTVRTLVDDGIPAGGYSFLWNALDDDQQPVPAGMYVFQVEIDGVPGDPTDVLLVYLDPDDFLTAPNAVTDASGRFRISDRLIPIGETFVYRTDDGETVFSHTIGDTLRVLAVRQGDPGPVWSQITVQYDEGAANRAIEIVLD